MINPFSGPPTNPHSDPRDPPTIKCEEDQRRAVRMLQIGQARLEERVRLNWLLSLAIFGGIVARLLGVGV